MALEFSFLFVAAYHKLSSLSFFVVEVVLCRCIRVWNHVEFGLGFGRQYCDETPPLGINRHNFPRKKKIYRHNSDETMFLFGIWIILMRPCCLGTGQL